MVQSIREIIISNPPELIISAWTEMLNMIANDIKSKVVTTNYKYSNFEILYLPREPISKSKGTLKQQDLFTGEAGWKIMENAQAMLGGIRIPSYFFKR